MSTARTAEDCDHLLGKFLALGDLDAIVGLYEPTACFVNDTREKAVGHDAIRASFRDFAAAKPKLTAKIVLSAPNGDDLVLLYNDWTLEMTGPDGKPLTVTGKAIEAVRRQPDGTWRFAIDDPFARS